MDQKWVQILITLVFCQNITFGDCGDKLVKEDKEVEISCTVSDPGSTVVWFRVLDTLSIEFIASFGGLSGDLKKPFPSQSPFSSSNTKNHITLKSFKKALDSGAYSCASQRGQEMKFGQVTRLVGEKVKVQTEAPPKTIKPLPYTPGPCVCDSKTEKGETSPLLLCSPLVLGPLVGGCGLLLLLLIVTTLYCNKIRTRRCPHHYKRKPRAMPPGKQMMPNRPL